MNNVASTIHELLLLVILGRFLIMPGLVFQPATTQASDMITISPAFYAASDRAQTTQEQTQGNFNASSPEKSPDYLLIAVIALAVSGFSLVLLGSALKRTGR